MLHLGKVICNRTGHRQGRRSGVAQRLHIDGAEGSGGTCNDRLAWAWVGDRPQPCPRDRLRGRRRRRPDPLPDAAPVRDQIPPQTADCGAHQRERVLGALRAEPKPRPPATMSQETPCAPCREYAARPSQPHQGKLRPLLPLSWRTVRLGTRRGGPWWQTQSARASAMKVACQMALPVPAPENGVKPASEAAFRKQRDRALLDNSNHPLAPTPQNGYRCRIRSSDSLLWCRRSPPAANRTVTINH